MILEKYTLKEICGTSKAVVIYGLNYKHNEKIRDAISRTNLGLNVYLYDSIPFKMLKSNEDNTKRLCKTTLVNLILENYQRKRNDQPIIPLIFCLNYEDNRIKIEFNARKAATSHSAPSANITDAEIRRIYKIYLHQDLEIKHLVLETFKFVKLVKTKNNQEQFEIIAAPFLNETWEQAWKYRKSIKKPTGNFFSPRSDWRNQFNAVLNKLKKENPPKNKPISNYTPKHPFFLEPIEPKPSPLVIRCETITNRELLL